MILVDQRQSLRAVEFTQTIASLGQ
jgi:hypothetical protein